DTGNPPPADAIVDMGAFEFQIKCMIDADCDDSDECTIDRCDDASSLCVYEGVFCDDGLFCNGLEQCVEGACEAGDPPDCDDHVDCTIDSCSNAAGSCRNTADHTFCDNGVFCDGAEVCNPVLGCQAGPPIDCDDNIDCTIDTCSETTRACHIVPDDSLCDNGLYCDGAEVCDPQSGCQEGMPVDCDDDIECTVDTCNEDNGTCQNVPDDSLCDDDLYCNGAESCDAVDACRTGAEPCPPSLCDEDSDTCGGCVANADCDDGVFCNGLELCESGSCVAGTPISCSDGVGCTADGCDEASRSCTHAPRHGVCDNGQFCDGAESCNPGSGCQPAAPPNCDDGVDCTADACNELTDTCDHVPSHGICDDGLFCNGAEECDPQAGCRPGSDPCSDRLCDEHGDACVECMEAADCSDDDSCTEDSCADRVCVHALLPECEDADGDGVLKADDACPEDPDKIAPGECGCGVIDADTDEDGVADCDDDCPETDPGEDIGEDGCPQDREPEQPIPDGDSSDPPDGDADGIPDEADQCPETSPGTEVDDSGCSIVEIIDDTDATVDERRSCGACGAFGMVSWSLLLLGLLGLKSTSRRVPRMACPPVQDVKH
ncbi:MAG: hypothetical protein JSU63_03135, partial [Phycisphaerales bacterium]